MVAKIAQIVKRILCLYPECTNPKWYNPDDIDIPHATIPTESPKTRTIQDTTFGSGWGFAENGKLG